MYYSPSFVHEEVRLNEVKYLARVKKLVDKGTCMVVP
jgi:hypothetical protein